MARRQQGAFLGRTPAPQRPAAWGGGDIAGWEAWPLPADPPIAAALDRLMAMGAEWASRRGWSWCAVLNGGSERRPLHRFRWEVVASAVAFAAGRAATPPVDYAALPLGLQAFLQWALAAAVTKPVGAAVDLERSRRAVAEADGLAMEMAAAADPRPRPHPAAAGRPPVAPPAAAMGDVGELLASALGGATASPLPPGAAEVLDRLRAGPMPLPELRALALARGTLLGALLDALDTASVRLVGNPATRVEGGMVELTAEYRAAGAQGEDALG